MPANKKPLSMRDIADLAGVSVATVSRVINNNGRFSEETRKRVQKVIDENDYVTNMAAKSLRQSRTKTIGMIVPDISNDFYSTLALHAEQRLARDGYSVFVCNDANDLGRERNYIRSLASKRVDGIICISGSNALSEGIVPENIPVVCVDRYSEDNAHIPRVISDDVRGGRIATEHLINQGCRHILLLSSLANDINKLHREQGYRMALESSGLPWDERYCVRTSGIMPVMEEANEIVGGFLGQGLPLDGIFAVSDHAAVGALQALKKAGVEVPNEVRIVGYDDSVYTRITSPSITSIRRYPGQMAVRGCEVLLKLIQDEKPEPELETVMPVSLVKRQSTLLS